MGLFKKSPEKEAEKKAHKKKKELKKLVKAKNYDKVMKVGFEVLETIPYDHDVLFILGGIFYMRKKYKTALGYFDKSLKISSYDPDVLLLKANSLFRLGNMKEAISCCYKSTQTEAKNNGVKELLSKIERIK